MNAEASTLVCPECGGKSATAPNGIQYCNCGITNRDDPLSTSQRMRAMNEIEREPTLKEAKEVPLYDMTEAELAVVILHDEDLATRREALQLYRLEILLHAENRVQETLWALRKGAK